MPNKLLNNWASLSRADGRMIDAIGQNRPYTPSPQNGVGIVQGLFAVNNAVSPNTKMDISFRVAQAVGIVGVTTNTANFVSVNNAAITQTVDIGLAGPSPLGRDQAAAFTNNQMVGFWIVASSDGSTSSLIATQRNNYAGPILPSGYTRVCHLFNCLLDGSGHLESLGIGQGAVLTNNFDLASGNRGYTLTSSPGQILVSQGNLVDPAFVFATGDISVGSSGAVNLASQYQNGYLLGGQVAVNLNALGDNTINLSFPNNRFMIRDILVLNTGSTASLTAAQFGVFTLASGGGVAIFPSGTALTAITQNSPSVAGNMKLFSPATDIATAGVNPIYFRVTQVQGASATANVYAHIIPLP